MADPAQKPTVIQATPELLEALRQAASRPMTADEIKRQRISWCVGQTGHPRDRVAATLRRMEGEDADGR